MTVRTVLAEDNALLRDGVARLLADHGIDVVASVTTAEDLLAAVQEYAPDIAVVDVRMPPTHTDEGLRAALAIRRDHPSTAVLVFSQWVETSYARRLLAGEPTRIGYLLKDRIVSTGDFIASLRRVAAGGTALDPEVVRQLFAAHVADEGIARLSLREKEILSLLAEGRSNAAIAERLHLADRSVEKHITAIFTKLDLPHHPSDHRRVLAVLRYLQSGQQGGGPG